MQKLVQRVAAKAVIEYKGKILLLRESAAYSDGSNAGKYVLPGGRVEMGETFFNCLEREIKEETGLRAIPVCPIYIGEWKPTIQGIPTQIFGVFIHAKTNEGSVILSSEHDKYLWLDPTRYRHYRIAPPDDEVIKAFIRSNSN